MNEIIYAIKMTDLKYSGLSISDVKIGKTGNIKSTLSQYRRGNRGANILDLWEPNPSKTLSECEQGVHKIAEKYAYERDGEKFIFLQEDYDKFSSSISLLFKKVSKDIISNNRREVKKEKKTEYTGKNPTTIKFLNQFYQVNSWREVFHVVAYQIYKNQDDFSPALKIKGKKRKYFSKNSSDLKDAKKLESTPYFFEGNISANQIVSLINKLLETFGYRKDSFKIVKYR